MGKESDLFSTFVIIPYSEYSELRTQSDMIKEDPLTLKITKVNNDKMLTNSTKISAISKIFDDYLKDNGVKRETSHSSKVMDSSSEMSNLPTITHTPDENILDTRIKTGALSTTEGPSPLGSKKTITPSIKDTHGQVSSVTSSPDKMKEQPVKYDEQVVKRISPDNLKPRDLNDYNAVPDPEPDILSKDKSGEKTPSTVQQKDGGPAPKKRKKNVKKEEKISLDDAKDKEERRYNLRKKWLSLN